MESAGLLEVDQEKNRRIQNHAAKLAAREQSDLRKVLSSAEGRRLVYRLLAYCQVYALTYAGGEHWQTNFNEGKRSVGIELLKQIPPDIELAMKREAANDQLLRTMELKEINDATDE